MSLFVNDFSGYDIHHNFILIPLLKTHQHFTILLLILPHHLQLLHIVVINLFLLIGLTGEVSLFDVNNGHDDDSSAEATH